MIWTGEEQIAHYTLGALCVLSLIAAILVWTNVVKINNETIKHRVKTGLFWGCVALFVFFVLTSKPSGP